MELGIDIEVVNEGTVVLFRPLTQRGEEWLEVNVQAEAWQWLGKSLAVDHRYAGDLCEGTRDDAGLYIG